MASGSELPEYSSSAKRRKIDLDVYDISNHLELNFTEDKHPDESSQGDIEGNYY